VAAAIYSDSGDTGTGYYPVSLLAMTGTQTAVLGWNKVPLASSISLSTGNYWLAVEISNGTFYFHSNANTPYANWPYTIFGEFPNNWGGAGYSTNYICPAFAGTCP
jgi:hypothetical protein